MTYIPGDASNSGEVSLEYPFSRIHLPDGGRPGMRLRE